MNPRRQTRESRMTSGLNAHSRSRWHQFWHQSLHFAPPFVTLENMITHKAKNGNGTLIRRGNVYYAAWMFNGKKYRVSTGETTEREARKRLAEIMANFTKGRETEAVLESVKESLQKATSRNLKICEAFAVYEANKLRKPVTESTIRVYRLRFGVFAKWATGKVENIDDVSPEVARRFMSQIANTASPKTFNDYLSMLALTWKTFLAEGYASQNPWAWNRDTRKGIERKEKDTHTKSDLTPEQLDALFMATDGEMRTLFFIGLYTGLRLKDCALLKWEAVDLEGGFIRTKPEKTKRHNIAVSIPILPPLAEALRAARAAGEGVGYVLPELANGYQSSEGKYLNNRLVTVFRRAGIKTTSEAEGRSRKVTDYGFHSLRHTFVSMAARAGIRQEVVREIVGHTNTAMTLHYTHTNEADLQAALSAFPAIGHTMPVEREDGEKVIDIPVEAETSAETRLAALARIFADMDGDELEEAARMLENVRSSRKNDRMEVAQ